jgi:hypothetical protein
MSERAVDAISLAMKKDREYGHLKNIRRRICLSEGGGLFSVSIGGQPPLGAVEIGSLGYDYLISKQSRKIVKESFHR